MVKITVSESCGNSPKQLFLKDFNIAFAEGNNAFIIDSVSDDITWDIVGNKVIQGKPAFVDALGKTNHADVAELILNTIITHGREGCANGEIVMKNGERYAFCDVYIFTGAKGTHIKSIQSFNIVVKG